MKKEDFIVLGISEELAVKAEKESQKELQGYVPKADFEAANTAKASLENDIKARDEQLEEIMKSSGDNEELKKQIETLQTENKTAKEKYEADMKELSISTAIKLALGNSAHDADLVSGLFDRNKLILGEDGKVSGLEEQLKAIKKDKAFLFKEEKPGAVIKGGKPAESGGTPLEGGKKPSEMTYSEMCAYLEANPGAKIE